MENQEEKHQFVKEDKTEKMSRFFLDYVDEIPTMQGKVAVLFEGFFKNKMQHVISVLINPTVKRDPAAMRRMVQNLEDLYHHFCPRDSYHESLFEDLIKILQRHPEISRRDSQRGLQFVKEIFAIFDYPFDLDKRGIQDLIGRLKAKRGKARNGKAESTQD